VSEVAELFFGDSFFDMLCQLCICVVPEQGIVCCNITCPKIIILCDWSATFKSEKHNIMQPIRRVLITNDSNSLTNLHTIQIMTVIAHLRVFCSLLCHS
jgi:hypothetical protein